MGEAVEFPDTCKLVLSILRAFDEDTPAHARVPNPRPPSFYRVLRTGGPRVNFVADGASVVVESWAGDEEEAHGLAQGARTALHAAASSVVGGTPIYRVTELSGPGRLPDPASEQARYTQTFMVMVRGSAPA